MPRSAVERAPVVSVIVPTYERPERLAECLASLAALETSPASFEVIVVDDGSRVPLDTVLAPFRGRIQVTLARQDHAGPAAARNTGADIARGRFLAFLDDDCRPTSGWLPALVRRLETTPRAVVGGSMLNGLPHNLWSVGSYVLVEAVDAYFNRAPAQASHLTSGNLALSRADFLAIGGFDPTLRTSEDRDFCDRCAEAGYTLIMERDAAVTHVRPLTPRTFWRQHFEYGRGTLPYHRRRARRAVTPFAFGGGFYVHLLRYPFGRHPVGRALLLSGLLGVTQAAKTTGLLWQWIRHPSDGPARERGVRAPFDPGNAGDLAD
jgi:glycosyltransferase involved in cell wall biosynthesis